MAEQYAVPIDPEAVPYRFDIDIDGDGQLYTLEAHYNSRFDYYTLDLYRDGEPVVYGAKLTYGEPVFGGLVDERLPKSPLVPRDVAGVESTVSSKNLGKTVFLFIDGPEAVE